MIDRQGAWIEMACDECGTCTGDTYLSDEFGEMMSAAKRAGWKTEAKRGGWIHTCPWCLEPPPLDDAFEEEFDEDIEAILGPSKDHET